ncbi:MAG: protein of unknown function DUF84 [uncultured bacterium]|nr:MAG: protein of unknown function DUF84 [uncultured bacterium]
MKVNIGSKNEVKIKSVVETLKNYPMFSGVEVVGVEVLSPEFGMPKTLSETIGGAKQRAKDAFVDCDYSFGIETGLMPVVESKTGFMVVTICAIFDGINYHLGSTPLFEFPKKVIELIVNNNLDGSQAYKASGLTNENKIGSSEGAVYDLTKGRTNRKEFTKQAVMTALIHLENPSLF